MTYSESQSQSSFRPVDYNDLDLTFSQETSYSHYHARQNGDDFKLTLRSIDDNELDDFRRSLITPMSNNNIQDPMYAEFERTNTQPKDVSNKRHQTLSPTNSYADSVADSLAVFNRLLDEQKSSDDFLAGDLNDFMSPYNMDDLVSLPPPSSSPQTNHRTNITSAYQTKHNVPLNHTDNTKTYATSYNQQRKTSIDASVQTINASPTRTSSKERLETKYGIKAKPEQQQPIKKLQPKQQEDKRRWSSYLPDKKSTIKLSQLSERNKLSATTATKAEQQSASAATQQLQNKGRALPLSDVKLPLEKRNSTHSLQRSSSLISKPSKDPAPTTTISSRFRKPTNDSSAVRNTTATTSRFRKPANDSSAVPSTTATTSRFRKPANDSSAVPSTTTTASRFKKPAVDDSSAVPATSTSRFLQRSNPNRMSWNDSSSYQKETAKQQEEKSKMYLHRRLSLMTDNNEQTTTPAKTSSKIAAITKTERPNKDVTQSQPTTSRYAQKRLSIRTTKPVEITKPVMKEEPKNTSISLTRRNSSNHVTFAANDNTDVQKHEISPVRKTYGLSKQVSLSSIPVPNTTTSTIPAPNTAASAIPASTTSSLLRRARSLTAPSSKYMGNSDQTQKPSLMPVPTFRHRRLSGNNLSKYVSVPEEEVAASPLQPTSPPVSPQALKGARYSLSKQRILQPVASHSSSGQSNATTCSSHSEDMDYNPVTPPSSYTDPPNLYYERRRSFTKEPTNITRLNKYGSYLAKMKDTYEVDIKPKNYSRQRVLSEDNNQYKEQKRRSVTESAREVLAQVQERRAKTAAILNSIHYS
ncbi:hypothetical protein BD770DRAFT_393402 [Pilaira anomala]|nr:hypothetical protein BD770DRAFT_393402 [Pilaira anomala]